MREKLRSKVILGRIRVDSSEGMDDLKSFKEIPDPYSYLSPIIYKFYCIRIQEFHSKVIQIRFSRQN